MMKYIEFLALHSEPEPVKRQVEDGCGIECQQLTDDQASDNTDSEWLPKL